MTAAAAAGRDATGGDASAADTTPGPATVEDRRGFGWLTAVVMTRSVLYYGLSAFLVVYLTTRLHAGPGTATLALTAFTGIGALSTLASSHVTRRLGRATTLLLCYLAAAGVLVVLLLVTRPVVAVGVAALLGVVLSVPVPVHTTLGQSYLPRHLGLASAVTLGLAVSTGGLATPVLGALADHHGITAAFAALLVLPALAAVLVLPLRHRARPR